MAGALIGALRVSLSAETSAFEAGMKRSQRTAKATANSIVSDFKNAGGAMNALKAGVAGFVASLSVGTIIAAGKAALDYAASLGETAEQLGVTTRELQNFRAAALQSGASAEEADSALGKLSLNMSKAISGSKQSAAAFASVGVSINDLTTKSRWEIIGQIADQMNRQGGAAKNAAAGTAIFGRGFSKIIPTLNQGSSGLNALAEANERLGGVLSDKEIQNADKTADKIEQLNLVLKAKLASDVAANSNAIAEFTNFLFGLVNAATQARQALADFAKNYNLFNLGTGKAFGFGTAGRSVTTKLGQGGTADAEARRRGLRLMSDVPRASAGAPPQFLAGGGGGSRRGRGGGADDAERKRLEALREANQFDQEIRRAKIDVLNSERQLASDYIERRNISIQILEAERASFEADLQYQVAAGEKTQVQADQLRVERDRLDALEVDLLNQEETKERREEIARYAEIDYENAREKLELEAGLAETAAEQRDVQLRLLDLFYQHERAKLNTIMAEEKIGSAAWEEARRRLDGLNQTQKAREANVKAGTRGPWEDYVSKLPTTTEKWNEALEEVAANGLQSVEDGLVDILTGAKSVGDALRDIVNDLLRDLIRVGVRRLLGGIIGGGFAEGGYTGNAPVNSPAGIVHGQEYVINARQTKRFLPLLEAINSGTVPGMAMGGFAGRLPIARTSYSERVSVSNDNSMRGGSPVTIHAPITIQGNADRQTVTQIGGAMRRSVARATRVYG